MRFDPPLILGVLRRRYKRFFADVELADGRTITVHCANTGSMRGCAEPGSPAAISLHGRLDRKLPGSLELVSCEGEWVGVYPARANSLVVEACAAGLVSPWAGSRVHRREVQVPGCSSRFDLEMRDADDRRCLVEIKSVSWAVASKGRFPDATSVRARRHNDELAALALQGEPVAVIFCVQRNDVECVEPAWDVDPAYAESLRRAKAAGVQLLAYACRVDPAGIALTRSLPVDVGI